MAPAVAAPVAVAGALIILRPLPRRRAVASLRTSPSTRARPCPTRTLRLRFRRPATALARRQRLARCAVPRRSLCIPTRPVPTSASAQPAGVLAVGRGRSLGRLRWPHLEVAAYAILTGGSSSTNRCSARCGGDPARARRQGSLLLPAAARVRYRRGLQLRARGRGAVAHLRLPQQIQLGLPARPSRHLGLPSPLLGPVGLLPGLSSIRKARSLAVDLQSSLAGGQEGVRFCPGSPSPLSSPRAPCQRRARTWSGISRRAHGEQRDHQVGHSALHGARPGCLLAVLRHSRCSRARLGLGNRRCATGLRGFRV